MKIKSLIKEPWPRIIGIPWVAIVMTVLIDGTDEKFLEEFLVNLLFITVMWNGDYYIIKRYRQVYPELSKTHIRILITIISVCVYNLLADYILCTFLGFCNVEGFGSYFDEGFKANLLKNVITTFSVGALYEAGYFFEQWKRQNIEIEHVKSQQLRAELNVLKNQISPHFLFNSLNTLATLIEENPTQASKFTQKLSQVYRYILQFKDQEVIKLKAELEFVEAYIYLLKMRFENSLSVSISIEPNLHEKYVAPLTIQILVENAVKHNVVSLSKPLILDIYSENGKSLIVRNNLQRRTQGVESLNTGLENIKQRYKYLNEREIDIIETREHFLVALPLIDFTTEPEYTSL